MRIAKRAVDAACRRLRASLALTPCARRRLALDVAQAIAAYVAQSCDEERHHQVAARLRTLLDSTRQAPTPRRVDEVDTQIADLDADARAYLWAAKDAAQAPPGGWLTHFGTEAEDLRLPDVYDDPGRAFDELRRLSRAAWSIAQGHDRPRRAGRPRKDTPKGHKRPPRVSRVKDADPPGSHCRLIGVLHGLWDRHAPDDDRARAALVLAVAREVGLTPGQVRAARRVVSGWASAETERRARGIFGEPLAGDYTVELVDEDHLPDTCPNRDE